MKKKHRKIATRILLAIIIGFVLLSITPFLFKKQLTSLVKSGINEQIQTKVDFSSFSASIWKDFPNLTLQINDLTMWGSPPFEVDTMATVEKTQLHFDLFSLFRKQEKINVHAFSLINPSISLRLNQDGESNYQIIKKRVDTQPEESASISLIVKDYQVVNGQFLYHDNSNQSTLSLIGFNHQGTGNFEKNVFDLSTLTNIDSINFIQDGIAYIQNMSGVWDAVLGIDQNEPAITLKNNSLTLNTFDFGIDGKINLDETIGIDLQIDVQNEPFESLLSIIPAAYTKDFDQIKTNGHFSLTGKINGDLDVVNKQYPLFEMSLDVKEGYVQYPGFSKSIDKIAFEATLHNPDTSLQQMYVLIPRATFQIDQEPVSLSLQARSLLADPHIKAMVKGKANLEDWGAAFPVENLHRSSGSIQASIQIDFKQSMLEARDFQNMVFSGEVEGQNILVQYADQPEFLINNATLTMTPGLWFLKPVSGSVRSSAFNGDVRLNDPLALFSKDQKRKSLATMIVNVDQIDAHEWMDAQTNTENEVITLVKDSPNPLDPFDVKAKTSIDQLKYGDHVFNQVQADVIFVDDHLQIQNGSWIENKQPVQVIGNIGPLWDYLYNNDTLRGNLEITSMSIDLNPFLVSTASSTSGQPEASSLMEIPDRLDLKINSSIDQLLYSKYDIRNVQGAFLLQDKTFSAEHIVGKAFGGNIHLAGSYLTKAGTPKFNFKYDLENLDFQTFFNSVNSVRILAPIGKFLKGSFSSDMVASGLLTPSLMPEFSSLNLAGFIQTFNGSLQKFPPLEKLGDHLKIEELKNWGIRNTKNWFEVSEGRVELLPFDFEQNGIQLNISGYHHIGKTMNFLIKAGIPRSLLEKSGIGTKANEGIRLLENQATALGLDFSAGDYVYLDAFLSGKMEDPQIKIQLTGLGGKKLQDVIEEKMKKEVNAYKDTLSQKIETEIEKKKKEVSENVQNETDSLKAVIKKRGAEYLDSAKAQVGKETLDTIQKSVEDLLKTKLGKDSVLVNPGKEIDQINKVLKDFNPFKKKNKTIEKDTSSRKKE